MNNQQKAAAAIIAARASNPPVYCWIEPEWEDNDSRTKEQKIDDMQKEYPLSEIISVGWGE